MTFSLALRVRVSLLLLAVLVGGAACQRAATPASPVATDDKRAKEAPVEPKEAPRAPSTETERGADAAGTAQPLEPEPKVELGLATIQPGQNAEGASVALVSGAERRPLPRLPITVQIPVENDYRIVAGKPGFADFEEPLEFPAGQTERTVVIDLVPVVESAKPAP